TRQSYGKWHAKGTFDEHEQRFSRSLRPCDLVVGNERLPVDEEAIVIREEGDLEVVAREREDRVLRLPETHRHELGAVPLVAPEDVVTQIPGSRPGSTATGLLDVLEIRVGVLALRPAAPRTRNHTRFNAPPRRRISQLRPRPIRTRPHRRSALAPRQPR